MLLFGALERADGRAILWLPYRRGKAAKTREVALEASGWAVVGYSRAQALAEKAVLPVDFGALDGEAEWLDEEAARRQRPCLPPCHAGGLPAVQHGPSQRSSDRAMRSRRPLSVGAALHSDAEQGRFRGPLTPFDVNRMERGSHTPSSGSPDRLRALKNNEADVMQLARHYVQWQT